jgi:preprotein translocase subunit SecG
MDTNKLKLKATFKYVGRYLLGLLVFAAIALSATVLMLESKSGALTKMPTNAHEVVQRFMDVILAVSALVFVSFFILITIQYLMDLYQAGKK